MYNYFDTRKDYEMIDNMIENEMQRTKKQAIRSISTCVHFQTELFAKLMAYGYFESTDDAMKLADIFNLGKLDFLAIQDDFDAFKEYYLEHYVEAQNF